MRYMLDVFILAGYKPFGLNRDGFNSCKIKFSQCFKSILMRVKSQYYYFPVLGSP